VGVVSQTFKVKRDRSGGIAKKISRSRRFACKLEVQKPCIMSNFKRLEDSLLCVIALHIRLGIKGIFIIIHF